MRKALSLTLFAALAIALSACSSSGGVIPIGDRVDRPVRASTTTGGILANEPTTATNIVIPAGSDVLFQVNVPPNDEPALYIYIDEDLPMRVYRTSGSLYATSRSAASFAAGSAGLSGADSPATLAPHVAVAESCPGSCVIAPTSGSGTFYVEVANPTASARTVDLWAVLREYADTNEGHSADDPMSIFGGEELTESGAIETIGDQDYFVVEESGTMFFDYGQQDETGIRLQAEIIPFGGGESYTLQPGESTTVDFSDEVHVYATNARAAASANSIYYLTLE